MSDKELEKRIVEFESYFQETDSGISEKEIPLVEIIRHECNSQPVKFFLAGCKEEVHNVLQ